MAINRRNVLLGLGAVVGGGGALVGTGAFSSVSAARSVSVSTTGDGGAFLQIDSDSDYVTDDASTDTFEINFDPNNDSTSGPAFNEDAVTTIQDTFTITNNAEPEGSSPDITLGLASSAPSNTPPQIANLSGSATVTIDTSPSDGGSGEAVSVTFYLGDSYSSGNGDSGSSQVGSAQTPTLSNGEAVNVDVEIDTTSDVSNSDDADDQLYIVAVQGTPSS